MSNTKSTTAIQSTPQAIMYTAAVMTGTNWMTGTLSLGRSLGIKLPPIQLKRIRQHNTEAVHAASVFFAIRDVDIKK